MTTYNTKLTARIVFDSGVERFFITTSAVELDDDDKIAARDLVTQMRDLVTQMRDLVTQMRDLVTQMREMVRRAYRENSHGSITVGDMTINLHKTSAVSVSLNIYDTAGTLIETI